MNLKAEFSKAAELALMSWTLMALGWGLFVIGTGYWGIKIAHGQFGFSDLFAWGMLAMFLTALFLGCYRRNKACAVMVAFMLGFAGAAIIGNCWGGFFLDGPDSISIGDLSTATYIGLLIWVFGLLLLSLRFSKTILPFCIYVLFSVLAIAVPIGMADMR
jgi:hypothetical protein